MIRIRRSSERGHFDHGWLQTFHTFSFADYRDPEHMGFRTLRVINEDTVQPGRGFGTHPHRDMEIVTYVTRGALAHQDSMGNGSVIRPGDVQRMSAGTGVTHSEFNHSSNEPVHLLQIWILPERRGIEPGYEQIEVPADEKQGRLRLIASRDGGNGSVTIHQDARIYASLLAPEQRVEHALAPGRHAWVQVVGGTVDLNGQTLAPGDGAALSDESTVTLTAGHGGSEGDVELLLFDLG